MHSAVEVGFINQPLGVLNAEIYEATERKIRYDVLSLLLTYCMSKIVDIDET